MDGGLNLLVDASSLIFRAYFSTPDSVRAPDGTPVNAARGFLEMLTTLVTDWDPDQLCCAIDENWRPQWRVELINTYKVHRVGPDGVEQIVDAQLAAQMPFIYELVARCGVAVVGHPHFEAEDIIGTAAARARGRVAIVSGDRDLFQLVRDPDVVVLYPKRGVTRMDKVDEAYIEDRFGIPGRAYRDFAVLRGDPSDGLPGVRGIGDKTASALLQRYGSLQGIVDAAMTDRNGTALAKVRGALEYIERAVRVTTIRTDVPLGDIDLTRPRQRPPEPIEEVAAQFGLGSSMKRLSAALTRDRAT